MAAAVAITAFRTASLNDLPVLAGRTQMLRRHATEADPTWVGASAPWTRWQ